MIFHIIVHAGDALRILIHRCDPLVSLPAYILAAVMYTDRHPRRRRLPAQLLLEAEVLLLARARRRLAQLPHLPRRRLGEAMRAPRRAGRGRSEALVANDEGEGREEGLEE